MIIMVLSFGGRRTVFPLLCDNAVSDLLTVLQPSFNVFSPALWQCGEWSIDGSTTVISRFSPALWQCGEWSIDGSTTVISRFFPCFVTMRWVIYWRFYNRRLTVLPLPCDDAVGDLLTALEPSCLLFWKGHLTVVEPSLWLTMNSHDFFPHPCAIQIYALCKSNWINIFQQLKRAEKNVDSFRLTDRREERKFALTQKWRKVRTLTVHYGSKWRHISTKKNYQKK